MTRRYVLTTCLALVAALAGVAGWMIAQDRGDDQPTLPPQALVTFDQALPEARLSWDRSLWTLKTPEDNPLKPDAPGDPLLVFDDTFVGEADQKAVITLRPEPDRPWWKPAGVSLKIVALGCKPESVQVSVSVATRDWFFYQVDHPGYLEPGKPMKLDISMDPERELWKPVGHQAPWSTYTQCDLQELSVVVYSHKPTDAVVMVDDIRVEAPQPVDAGRSRGPYFFDVQANRREVPRHEKFEVSFQVDQVFQNPFDPDEVKVWAEFSHADRPDTVLRIPGFFYQGYRRSLVPARWDEDLPPGESVDDTSPVKLVEHLVPVGPKLWKVRFAPPRTGTWTYRLKVHPRGLDEPYEAEPMQFQCVDGPSHGYLRVSKTDPRYLEFQDGTFWFPRGHCIISPWDKPYKQALSPNLPVGKRTYAYDRYFEKMDLNGGNAARIWMSFWWVGLEWKEGRGPYHGIGRYSLENAWRIDHLLERADRHDMRLLLEIFSHVNLSTRFPIKEQSGWSDNPYNQANGGFLLEPQDFFSNLQAKLQTRKLLRYISARWGYSTNVMAWSLFSEVDLVDIGKEHRRETWENIIDWHEEMFAYLKSLDSTRDHILTSHHHAPKAARAFFNARGMEMITSNAYAGTFLTYDQVPAFKEYARAISYPDRPNLITEFGGHWGGSPQDVLVRDFHNGLWYSIASPLAGTPFFWWWTVADDQDLYRQYKPLELFLEGDDFRRPGTTVQTDDTVEHDSLRLELVSFGDSRVRRLWIYNHWTTLRVPDSPYPVEPRSATLTVSGLDDGRYRVEYWDTRRGGLVEPPQVVQSNDRKLKLALPGFRRDIACRIKPAD